MSTLAELCAAQIAFIDGPHRTYVEKTAAIQIMLDACEAAFADPQLTNQLKSATLRYTAITALEALRNSIYAKRASVFGLSTNPRTYVVRGSEPLTLWQIARELFNDGTRWRELLDGNAIHNPNAVRPGTVLYVLPR